METKQPSDFLKRIRELTIRALFSDDILKDVLILKGGNLIDIIYGVSSRSSMDLDFSIEKDLKRSESKKLKERMEKTLSETLSIDGLYVFDVRVRNRPSRKPVKQEAFWGGYEIEFKVIDQDKHNELGDCLDSLRRNAAVVSPGQKRKLFIHISKFEYCANKEKRELGGIIISVYSPIMVICEKLRAICQQRPEYRRIVPSHSRTERARDFLDIYDLFSSFKIEWGSKKNNDILRSIFEAKRVPIGYLKKIHIDKAFHGHGYEAVKATVHAGVELRDFGYYFEFVLKKCKDLETLGIV